MDPNMIVGVPQPYMVSGMVAPSPMVVLPP